MASVVVQGAPIVVQSVPPPPHPGVKYANIYKNLGITQLILGSASLILAIASLVIASTTYSYDGFSFISTGIWCGCLMLAAGATGIASSKNPSSCPITAGLILTIIAAIASGIMMALEIPAAITSSGANSYSYQEALTVIHSLLAIIAFGELVVAIIHSAYCCAVTCCYTYNGAVLSHGQRTVVTTTTHPMPVTSIPGQQIQYGYPPQQYFVPGAVAPPVQQTYPQGYQPAPVYQQVAEPMLPSYNQASSQPAAQQFQPPGYSEKQPFHQ